MLTHCPACQKPVSVTGDTPGRLVRCPHCRKPFSTSGTDGQFDSVEVVPPMPRRRRWPLVSAIIGLCLWGLVALIILESFAEFLAALAGRPVDALAAVAGISARIIIVYVIARCGEKLLAALDSLMNAVAAPPAAGHDEDA